MRTPLLVALMAVSRLAIAQVDTLISISLHNGAKAVIVNQNNSSGSCHTTTSTGSHKLINLPADRPSLDLIEGTQFTVPRVAERTMFSSDYPASTSVQLLMYRNNKLTGQCSGNLVAPDLVISAAHCLINPSVREPEYDQIIAAPAGVNLIDGRRMASRVLSAFVIKRFIDDGKTSDVMLLRLEESLGDHTGWIGISCVTDTAFITNSIFHKFSFPAKIQDNTATSKGGRQLHYNYGMIDNISENIVGLRASAAKATRGQSGSSFAYFDDERCYSIAVSIYERMYQHQRITKSIFDAFQPVIEESVRKANTLPFILYPNPIMQSAVLKVHKKMSRFTFVIVNSQGEIVRTQTGSDSDLILIDRGPLVKGEYNFRLLDDSGREARGVLRFE